MLLTLSPHPAWPDARAATHAALGGAAGLLLPHDAQAVADLRERPERWADLQVLTAALRRGVPVLGWGSGAALLGRSLGARVHPGPPEWTEAPRGAQVERWEGARPQLWQVGRALAWAETELAGEVRDRFLASLPGWADRWPGSPLEEIGGEAALRALLTDFYGRARADTLIGPMFEEAVHDWDAHLDRVTAFWITMLGGVRPGEAGVWRGDLNGAHAGLGLRRAHLERWLHLFDEAARAQLTPQAASLLGERARRMGERLRSAARRP